MRTNRHHQNRPRALAAAAAALFSIAGCGGSSTGGGGAANDMTVSTADMAVSTADMAMSAAGSVMGGVNGGTFNKASSSLWIGSPDDPATTVVYVFDNPVKCSDIKLMGWDKRIPDATQVLEMKMFGTTPLTYNVTASMTPAPGEASVNYTLSSQAGTPMETFGAGGTVVLTTRTAMMSATGSFMIDFGGGDMLKGTYNATYCPGGHEP